MIPATVPPFPFYIINKDIIKGSFPFRKTFHTPKPDFATRFQPPRVFRRPEEPEQTTETEQTGGEGRSACRSPISQPDFDRLACSADLKSRNKTTETEQTGGERNFPVRKTRQFKDYSIFLCPRRLQNPIPDIAVRSVRKSAFKPLRHRYCQVNPPAERLKNTHGNICNQVTSVDEFRCFSAFCA